MSECLTSALPGFQEKWFSNFQLNTLPQKTGENKYNVVVSLPWGVFTHLSIAPKANIAAESWDILQTITSEWLFSRPVVFVLHAYIFF